MLLRAILATATLQRNQGSRKIEFFKSYKSESKLIDSPAVILGLNLILSYIIISIILL